MPLSEESDPFARRHLAGSSGGETVPPWNGASGTRARCPVRVDQVQPEPVPARPRPRSAPERTRPASISSRNEKSQSERPAPPALAFLLPAARPDQHRRRPDQHREGPRAHGDGLPDLPGLGGVGLPDEQRTTRPITCPGCSFQPDPTALLPAPLPDLPTTPAASPPAPRRQPNARGVRFST